MFGKLKFLYVPSFFLGKLYIYFLLVFFFKGKHNIKNFCRMKLNKPLHELMKITFDNLTIF